VRPRPALSTVAPDDTSLARLSVLDWIGVALVVLSALVTLAVPLLVAPMFRRLSESLGAAAPAVGGTALQGWIPLVVSLGPLALVVYAVAFPQPVMRRRLFLVLAFVLTILASAVLLIVFYGTLFSMAGAASVS
jgi:hypothetical protein